MRTRRIALTAAAALCLAACQSEGAPPAAAPTASAPVAVAGSARPSASPPAASASASASVKPPATVKTLPKPGNPAGRAAIPAAARPVDTSRPDRTIGDGTPESCTSAAVVKAVAAGGLITFDCGPAPVTITMTATAKVRNPVKKVVLDGGGRVTLDGAGKRRILYMNVCDTAQGTSAASGHCHEKATPRLTVQNLVFARGNATDPTDEAGGGGAIFANGGGLKVVNSRFTNNRCARTGPDLGGAAIRVRLQGANQPVYVVGSTFTGGNCSNGGALSSIGVSWTLLNSQFSGNTAVGNGANPARGGTPGGGSGGAVYLDGNTFQLKLDGTVIEKNRANEGGGAVFFVSNDRSGTLSIRNSTLRRNTSEGFETDGLPGIFYLGSGNPSISGSRLTG
ncbi:hypothetical protein Ait01nite_024940 [Actinoplanes italicus]|uniref:Outer membrane repeat protein n=1 Tax=Actinoplanes italicus TaxID=113567 RepID=A0A2T0KFJ4_9ACTN|nr:hypothetical protein [Actinoplanes italicus]PRX22134.1 hypothetical protein CLV67_105311 [Actinoplanes italicus]GIE29449.1 hypothetical protein Ait01nite_024940 [Actinoplanes italicus]